MHVANIPIYADGRVPKEAIDWTAIRVPGMRPNQIIEQLATRGCVWMLDEPATGPKMLVHPDVFKNLEELLGAGEAGGTEVTVVGFLQNAWFEQPERLRRHAPETLRRIWLLALAGSYTGKKLRRIFGDSYGDIHWENASPLLANFSGGEYRADLRHIRNVLLDQSPGAVLAFGKIASDALRTCWKGRLICGPHPAARFETDAKLREMAIELAGLADVLPAKLEEPK